MAEFKDKYINPKHKDRQSLDQLLQLLQITWDGDLISKSERDALVKMGFCARMQGYNIITVEGIEYLHQTKIISS